MHTDLLALLRCPQTGAPLDLQSPEYENGRVRAGVLVSREKGTSYPIRDFIPRFVPPSNYADNFGMQWNLFRQTQLDSYSGLSISADRFWKATGWTPAALAGQWVLDCGCGAGRFAEVALEAGARVIALDYSSAADACYANLKHHPNLHVVQGDIYALPFAQRQFPFVYSLGVLQHTPDVARAFAALPAMVAPGGRLCADFYQRSWKSWVWPKYWLRPFTKRMSQKDLFERLQRMVPGLLRVSRGLQRIPIVGSSVKHLVPVANYHGVYPLNHEQLKEWALLDTFDMFAPKFDSPQTPKAVLKLLRDAGLEEPEVLKAGHLVGRGRRA
ncbi:MAG: methyltransferase domain-containing protein [Acidobacteriota bacterium]|nr:methyltransferase domain-containing protein [Acidobacteriota bacterium]